MKKLILFCLLFFAKQIIAQSGIITTVAGGFGLGNSTNLSVISSAMTIDNAGNIYFVDGTQFNSIRKLSPSGILSTYAGGGFDFNGDGGQSTNAYFHTPAGITMDVLGNLYIADQYHNTIRKVDVSGILSTIAGNGTGGFSGDGGQATNAELDQPATIAIDALGNVCFSDNNNQRVRKIDASGIISTIAGSGLTGFGGDGGQATQAKLTYPSGIAFDPSGNLYIGESVDYRIRKVATSGIITTIAGNGTNGYSGDGGQATLAEINYPQFLTIDALGNIYFAGSNVIREINTSSGIITTVAGNGTHGFSGDGGQATNAELFAYAAINDASGNLYISDNTRIRKVDATGIITTIAGNGWFDYGGDGDQATSAQIHYSNGVVLDSLGNLYISDNKHIRKVDISGVITTLAGNGSTNFSGDGGLATNAGLNKPCGMAIDSNNNLYIAETGHNCIRKITAGGVISTVAGGDTIAGYSGDGGPATAAQLNQPGRLLFDKLGNLYITDQVNGCVRMINTSGIITTIAGAGNSTGDGGAATLASLGDPIGLAFDALGNLYISDYAYHKIRKVTTTGIISTIAGNGTGGGSGDGGAATAALLNGPTDICFDKAGNLYITENAGSKIRMIDTLGIITTIGKNIGPNLLGDGGQINAASIYSPYALAFDKQGNLYFSEVGRKKIRKVSGCNTSISVSVTGNTNICKGISTTLTASGATSYIWSNNDSTATITLSPTASKTLTVIGLTGLCVSSASVVITVSPHLVVTGTSTLCPGSTATLTATGATSYTWSANAGNASGSSVTLNPINTSTYSVIGFDGTCTDTVFHTVNVIGINVANGYPGNINNPSNDSVCAPGNHDLYAQNCATYTWSPNAGGGHSYTAIVSPTVTTTYSVTGVLSACSLLVTDTITLYVTNSPTLSIVSNKPDTVCSGTNILLTASGASTYNWTMAYSNLTDSTSTFSTNITYPTTFTVTGSVNGCYSQTTYNVFAPTVYIYSNANFCLGNTATLHAGGMNTYTWSVNAGGTTSDSAVIAPTTNTTFYVKGTDNATSCQDSSSITINIVTGCVWPGDANEDLVVDNLDLLSVGLEYNHHYVQRNQLGNLWQGYNCSTWYDTLSNGKDIKYADCNGDGTINMNDTLPINLNYGLTHLARTSSPSTVQNTHPDMYITFNKPSYYPGDTVFSNILIGDITNVQNNFYGAAFTINYDNTQVKPNSERFYFNNSWVGNINQTKIKFSKVDANTGTVNASLVRTTHTDISGYGQVATLQFILKDTLQVNQLNFSIYNGIKTDYLGTYSNLNTGTDSAAILSITSVNSIKNNNSIAIYPNPTNSIFYLKTNTILENALIEVYDIMGRKVMIEKVQGNVTAINLNTLNNAIYQIRLLNNNALIYQGKIVKQQ